MKKALRTLRSRDGRVARDVEHQLGSVADTDTGRSGLWELIGRTRRILSQKQKDKNKLYALHAPEAECLVKVQGAYAVRIRRQGADQEETQGKARDRGTLDAGQSV